MRFWDAKRKFESIFGQLYGQHNRTGSLKERIKILENCLERYIFKVNIMRACFGNPKYKMIPPENVPTLSSEELANYHFKGYYGSDCLYVHEDSLDLVERIMRLEKAIHLIMGPKDENS